MDNQELYTEIWKKYDRCREYLNQINLVARTEECWRFYLGDQWHGLESGGERLPLFNIIKGVVRYKTSVVAQNAMIAVYSPMGRTEEALAACDTLNMFFRQNWEKGKLDAKLWTVVKRAQIQGESYLFYGTDDMTDPQILSNVNVLFADEQETDIQKQPYILIYERRSVKSVREEAKANNVAEEEIARITSDTHTEYQLGGRQEAKATDGDDGKCESILFMEKDEDGIVWVARSTKSCVYQPKRKIQATDSEGNFTGIGLRSYPIVPFVWEEQPNSCRGYSGVRAMIPNQLELNKTLARRSISVKMCAFPKVVYDGNVVTDPAAIDKVGQKVRIQNLSARNISDVISYLNPATMSSDAKALAEDLLSYTRDLEGAGEAATGQIDPEKASGTAILAVKNQSELPLNEYVSRKTQFVEDLAMVWFDMILAYMPNGLTIEDEDESGTIITREIPADILEHLRVNVRVDVSQANPFSKLAREQALERMLEKNWITFEEYVDALDEDSNVPKAKVKEILEKRKAQAIEGANST